MRTILHRLYRLCDWLAAIAILLLGLIVVAQILGRLAGIAVPGAHEAAAFLMATAIYLALAYTMVVDAHIRVTLLLERLSPKLRWWADLWCHLFSIYIIGFLTYFSMILAWESWQGGEMSEGLAAIPVFLPQSAMALGILLLLVRLIDQFVQLIQSGTVAQESMLAEATANVPGGFV